MMIREDVRQRYSSGLVRASILSAAFCGLFLAACDSSSDPGSGEGEIRMQMVDAPADVEAVMIAVTRIDVHTSGSAETEGWVTVNNEPTTYDLLSLRNGSTSLIAAARLRAGHYTQIRLILGTGSHVVVNGVPVELIVSSGLETGIKLNHQFTIESDKVYEVTLDFDADRSIKPYGVFFRLQPVIRIFVNETSGSLSGTVLPPDARALVVALSGSDTVSTTQCDSGTGYFKFPVIPEGTYDLDISATAGVYADTLVAGVQVVSKNETDVGFITLSAGPSP